MPMEKARYPGDWTAIARGVKRRAGWCCEECGKACLLPGEDWFDFCVRQGWTVGEAIAASQHPKRYELDAAHVNHDPENPEAELVAWCNPCHCRNDLAAIKRKQWLNRERHGQLHLFDLATPQPAGHGADPTRIQIPIRWEV
jgi:hypothetical protein